MNRWTVLFAAIMFSLFVAIGCSGGGGSPVASPAGPEITSGSNNSGQIQQPNTSLLGYFDVYLDVGNQTMEVVEDRTASYTINIVPFLNKMTTPQYGISLGSLDFDDSDPSNLKVGVVFKWHHPFPTITQYKVYDFMGVIISNGDLTLDYHSLRVGNYGSDTYMTNADGYTRWFNPTEFTTEQIFGWAPGGIQNLKGSAKLNPFKAYGYGLSATGSLWNWLEGSNHEGVFQPGDGRTMLLEFPMPTDGLVFGYVAVCCWEEQGTGPYTPYHRDEPIAFRVTVEDDLYYDGADSGGNLIADIDVWAWGDQPVEVLVESTVLAALETAAPTGGGGANWSTYSIDVSSAPFDSTDGQEMWVIAETDGNYINISGVSAPPGSEPLAAFYRFPLFIADTPYNTCPVIDDVYDDVMGPGMGILEFVPSGMGIITYTCDAHDVDMDTLTFTWYVTDDGVTLDPLTDGLPGNAIDWYLNFGHGQFDLYVGVDDGSCETFGGPFDICANDTGVATVVGEPEPKSDSVETYDVQAYIDPDGDSLSWDWTITDVSTGDPVTTGWTDNMDGSIEVDWTAVGAQHLDEYTIDCDILDMCQTIPADTLDILINDLYEEYFDTDPGDWCLATYQYWSGCNQGPPCWRIGAPYGIADGVLATPCSGSGLTGGSLQTHVSPPFDCATGSEVTFRCAAMWDLGGSWPYYTKTNFAVAASSASGCSPFSTTSCAGGTIMQRTTAHGGTTPAGWVTSGGSGPCAAYAGWRGNFNNWPSNITNYLDLVIPSSFHGQTIKVAFRCHPDWCGYPGGNTGIVIDDVQNLPW